MFKSKIKQFNQFKVAIAPVNPGPIEQYKLQYKYTWIMYRLYCHNHGLTEGNYNNFRSWCHGTSIRRNNQI